MPAAGVYGHGASMQLPLPLMLLRFAGCRSWAAAGWTRAGAPPQRRQQKLAPVRLEGGLFASPAAMLVRRSPVG